VTFIKKKIRTRAQFQNVIVSFGFIFICIAIIAGIFIGVIYILIQFYKKITNPKSRNNNYDNDNNDENINSEDINDNYLNNSVSLSSIGKKSNVDTEFEREINNEQEYERINKNSIV
jgi:MFS superfamily sulfate permease-like transporter